MTPLTNIPNLKQRHYGGAYSVHDPEIVAARDRLCFSRVWDGRHQLNNLES